MKDQDEVLWGLYQEHLIQQRHHESQTASMTSIIMAVSGGILAFIASKSPNQNLGYLPCFLIAIGLFGALLTAKQSERAQFHRRAADAYRKFFDELHPGIDLKGIRENAESEHRKLFPVLQPFYLYHFWIALHGLIAILGVILALQ